MKKRLTVLAVLLVLPMAGWGADSGFMDDYSILEDRPDHDAISRVYIAPGTLDLVGKFDAVLVDQPEVFMSADSKYLGAKPDHIKTLADTSRLAFIERLEAGGYRIAEEAGPGVVYARWAITELYLKKKKRNILSYTPVGFVAHATAQAAIRDLWRKIDIVELNIEVEFIDSVTGDLLAAVVMGRGARKTKGQKQELVSWEELDATMKTFGQRLRCTLDNARIEANQRQDCSQIYVEVET